MKIRIILFGLIWLIFLIAPPRVNPEDFYRKNGEIYDSWYICRTRPHGIDGYFQVREEEFRPIIIFESLGKNVDVAYQLGRQFLERYPDLYQRAERIYSFVRDQVAYTSDLDQFGYPEFAQNADELARRIKKGRARGDCEDYAILLAAMYKAAGYRSAIVIIPGHAAALVYLPGYRRANVILQFNNESGWIWAEATGRTNPFGWCPPRAMRGDTLAYEIKEIKDLSPESKPKGEIAEIRPRGGSLAVSPFLSVLFIMWIVPMIGRFFIVILRRG